MADVSITQEIWCEIPGYEGLYSVSNHGRVKMDYDFGCHHSGHILSTCLDKYGYVRTRLTKQSKRTQYTVHRLVMLAFTGIRPENMEVNHIDGIKTNNHISNLEYCTSSQNKFHAFGTGLRPAVRTSNLTHEDIKRIRKLHTDGMQGKDIAKLYDKSRAQISRIVNRANWSNVE